MRRHSVRKVSLKSASVSGPIAATGDGPALPLQSSARGRERSEEFSREMPSVQRRPDSAGIG